MGNSVSGSHDINAFRGAVQAGSLPRPSAITWTGMFNEHFFKSSDVSRTSKLIAPVVDYAVATSPRNGETEYWLACFSKSCLDGVPQRSRPIRLIVALDVSGSMSDTLTIPKTEEDLFKLPSKISVAKGALVALLEQLQEGDQFGFVTFNEAATTVQELCEVSKLDQGILKEKIDATSPGGDTVLASGILAGNLEKMGRTVGVFGGIAHVRQEYDTILHWPFLLLLHRCLHHLCRLDHAKGIHASFIGVGVDFDTTVTERVTKVKGSNYFCILSEAEFKKRLSEEFVYNFFPMAYDVEMRVTVADNKGDEEKQGFVVDKVYGTPYGDELEIREGYWSPQTHGLYPSEFRDSVKAFLLANQRLELPKLPLELLSTILNMVSPPQQAITRINTSFPSATKDEDEQTKGGLILVKLKQISKAPLKAPVTVRVQMVFKDTAGNKGMEEANVTISPPTEVGTDYFSSPGVQKGLMLYWYVAMVKKFLRAQHEAQQAQQAQQQQPPQPPQPQHNAQKKAEKSRAKLHEVSKKWKTLAESLNDPALMKEAEVLDNFLTQNPHQDRHATGGCTVM